MRCLFAIPGLRLCPNAASTNKSYAGQTFEILYRFWGKVSAELQYEALGRDDHSHSGHGLRSQSLSRTSPIFAAPGRMHNRRQ